MIYPHTIKRIAKQSQFTFWWFDLVSKLIMVVLVIFRLRTNCLSFLSVGVFSSQ